VSKLPKKWTGLHPHRLKDNALEKKTALAWAALNAGDRSTLDYLMDVTNKGNIRATDHERLTACTLVQWLGSPVGFAWLVDTFGLAVMREMQERVASGEAHAVRPGQVYRSLDNRDKGREVTVERLRYDVTSRLYRRGDNTHWAVRSSTTGRMSYIYERRLLDTTQWMLV